MLDFDPAREGVTPKDAATLLVLRQRGALEVFFVRRHAQSAFMGGVVVFPGGKLDEADASLPARADGVDPRAVLFARDEAHALALAVCACRESLEEAALLPAVPAPRAAALEALRAELAGGAGFGALLEREGLALTTKSLLPFARWITPKAEGRRYDARFFVTFLPEGQEGAHDAHETISSVWATPGAMLEAFARGDVFLAPPTVRALELLAPIGEAAEVAALCAAQSLLPICPELVSTDPVTLALPGDPLHSIRERHVAGGTRFVLRDGRLQSSDCPKDGVEKVPVAVNDE
jgi:8-oxo-dGTP pyrophosphatase MutT (NUDIX family)